MGEIILISIINFIFVILGYTLGTNGDKDKVEHKTNKFYELFKKEDLEEAYIPEDN